MDLSELQSLLSRLKGKRVVCIGDLMVDQFVHGEAARLSAEAPVPIMSHETQTMMLGAAGNVARNIAALGGEVALVGVVGDDRVAHQATELIGAIDGLQGYLVTQAGRATGLKTRFIAGGQQLLRVDHEDVGGVSDESQKRLIDLIDFAVADAGAILLSDYAKGVVTEAVIAACLAAARKTGAPLIVDSKARGFARFGEADVVKPNAAELAHATDLPTGTDEEVAVALEAALSHCACRAILVTRSAKGMSLAVRGKPVRHFPGLPRQVFDVGRRRHRPGGGGPGPGGGSRDRTGRGTGHAGVGRRGREGGHGDRHT